jgi:hypothetical protein
VGKISVRLVPNVRDQNDAAIVHCRIAEESLQACKDFSRGVKNLYVRHPTPPPS